MEKQFFDWEDWDEIGNAMLQFTNCELTTDIGNWNAGERVPSIAIDFQNGNMVFHDQNGKQVDQFKLALRIVPDHC